MSRRNRITMVIVLALAGLAVLAAVGCSSESEPSHIANPASEYCVEQGGTLDIRTDADGGEVGYCQFDDDTECEEWAFYRGECGPGGEAEGAGLANPASQHCVDQGGKVEIRTEADGEVGYCLFADGSECEEWAFYRGDCAPGTSKP